MISGNEGSGVVAGCLETGVFAGITVGGSTQEANEISFNGTDTTQRAAGVAVNTAYGVSIRHNSIHDNNGLGIDLKRDGVTENDCFDFDADANFLQNYPNLLAPVQEPDGGLTVAGILNSAPEKSFTLDFCSSQTADPTNYGEGAKYIGTKTVNTNGNGFASFSFTSANPVSTNLKIMATATDGFGNTSEFSCAAGLCTGNFRHI